MTVPEQDRRLTHDEILEVLNHIGFPLKHPNKLPPPTMETLAEFQYRSITTIPFETLSLRLTKERHVDITLDGILNRILRQRRGGWCFSLNRLAYEVLVGLGFQAQWVVGRICKPEKYGDPIRFGAPTHRITLVRMEDGTKYVVDIGFGTSYFKPIELRVGAEIEFFGHRRRITRVQHPAVNGALGNPLEEMWLVEEWLGEDRWGACYSFTETPSYEVDAELSNWYTCHSPNSPCYPRFWVMKGTPDGKYYLLMQNEFKIRGANGNEYSFTCKTEKEREEILAKYYDIHLTDEERECNDQKLD
ncbi:N-terminal acetyltransferase [Actinomortierella ambigua]|nr:N-terminal acetyltransferase [Actinomortierella ambigua]